MLVICYRHVGVPHTVCNRPLGLGTSFATCWRMVTCQQCLQQRPPDHCDTCPHARLEKDPNIVDDPA